ncbi:hypothetical protein CHU95_05905 [Niveispirillum lacus]|uniref:Proteophosphoglycan n=2 Tax=Niveispirillum lacus TaxID=1981099 RepID=A0A255Z3B8_9PROT|nr:hypothetical protein CHU95_05905 [Niveispirillum lacus]
MESKQNGHANAPKADGATGADVALKALAGGAPRAPSAEDEAYPIVIRTDGTWTYHGSPIGRLPLVKLFATVLRRDEAGDFWLITPAERGRILVEDAPFVAVGLSVSGEGRDQSLHFTTNLETEVTAGPDHPIRVVTDPVTGEPRPYIRVKGPAATPLEARINRAIFYDLVERAEPGDAGMVGVWSQGVFFPLGWVEGD